MEEQRILLKRRRPTIMVPNMFGFVQGLELGEEGQAECMFHVEHERLSPDEFGNDMKIYNVKIVEGKNINKRK